MAKQLNWLQVDKTIRQNGLTLVSPQNLRHLLRGSESSLRFLLTRAHKRGYILKLRRELYTLPDYLPSELELANALLRPSYISFHYALAYFHVIPETVYEIASATTRTTRRFDILGKSFTYHHIGLVAFTGYRPETISGKTILIAEPEKALIDTVYFVNLRKLSLPERLDVSALDLERLYSLTRLYRQPDIVIKKLEALL
jgi:predicted transcriptional regulator of viral defense system